MSSIWLPYASCPACFDTPGSVVLALDPAFTSSRAFAPSGNTNRAIPARSPTAISTRTPFASVIA